MSHAPDPLPLYHRSYGEGEPLVILHGLLGASGNWHTLASKVFSTAFQVFALDQRNHGRSPHSEVFSYEAMSEDLIAFMGEQGLHHIHLMGHSMGGKTAMHFATRYPAQVARLIVVDIAPRAYEARHEGIFEALHAIDPSGYAGRQAMDDALAAYVPDYGIRQFLLKNLTLDTITKTYRWQMNLEGIYASYAHINEALPESARYDGPTLFIRGERSDYITEADELLIQKHFPQAEIATIAGAGHWVHAEAPEPFAKAVMAFLG